MKMGKIGSKLRIEQTEKRNDWQDPDRVFRRGSRKFFLYFLHCRRATAVVKKEREQILEELSQVNFVFIYVWKHLKLNRRVSFQIFLFSVIPVFSIVKHASSSCILMVFFTNVNINQETFREVMKLSKTPYKDQGDIFTSSESIQIVRFPNCSKINCSTRQGRRRVEIITRTRTPKKYGHMTELFVDFTNNTHYVYFIYFLFCTLCFLLIQPPNPTFHKKQP